MALRLGGLLGVRSEGIGTPLDSARDRQTARILSDAGFRIGKGISRRDTMWIVGIDLAGPANAAETAMACFETVGDHLRLVEWREGVDDEGSGWWLVAGGERRDGRNSDARPPCVRRASGEGRSPAVGFCRGVLGETARPDDGPKIGGNRIR